MNSRTRTGLEIIQVALIIGLLGNVLLRSVPWGLNVLLFNVAFVAGLIMLLRRHAPDYLTRTTFALLGALVFFAGMFVWRDSIELRIADTLAIITILAVLFVPKMKIAAHVAGVFHYGIAFLWSSFNAALAPAAVLALDIDWKSVPNTGWSRHLVSALRGVAIATPILLIFGALFVAADAIYAGWIQRVFNVEPDVVVSHIFLTGFFAWVSAGYLRGILIQQVPATIAIATSSPIPPPGRDEAASKVDRVRADSGEYPVMLPGNRSVVDYLNISDAPDTKTEESQVAETEVEKEKSAWNWPNIDNTVLPRFFTLGSVEIGVVFGLINLLFLSFVIVQVPYLFGGMELVQNTPDFKLAEYARRGFGELVAVSALVLPILLFSHWLIRKDTPFAEKLFRVLAAVQIVLLFVIMASAVQRLVLLTGNLGYGMTTIRLYPLIFMSWLAVVFVWFCLTVLRGVRQYFAWGALWAAFLILGATHVLNPDEFILKHNIALMLEGREFDANYNANLSDDAMPTLLDAIPEMNVDDARAATIAMARRYCETAKTADLRSWNWSRASAAARLDGNTQFIELLGGCESPLIRHRPYGLD